MVDKNEKSPQEQIVELYRAVVAQRHPEQLSAWPVLSGYNSKIGSYQGWLIVILNHTGNPAMRSFSGIGDLPQNLLGVAQLDVANKEVARSRLSRHFNLRPTDAIVFIVNRPGNSGGCLV